MTAHDPPTPPATRPTALTRPRLHLIYFALAAFDLLSISLGLYLINRISSIYSHSVQVNQEWGGRLDDYLELMRMAAAVNGPGNDVFETRAIEREWEALQQNRSAFEARAAQLRQELLENARREDAESLLSHFDQIEAAMALMVDHAEALFDHLRRDQLPLAATEMAEMDRQYVVVIGALRELGAQVRDLQRAHTEQQTATAAAYRRLELVIAGLIVVIVGGVTWYGHLLARQMKRAARESEEHMTALAASDARVRGVLASALDPILTIDPYGTIQSASNSLERVFGWKPEEVVGRNVSILMPEPHHSAHDGYLANYRRTRQTNILGRTREFEAVRKDGSRMPIELSVSRVDIPGRPEPLIMGIIHEISERRALENELARYQHHLEEIVRQRTAELESTHDQLRMADRLASIGTLAAGLGHDMNNVLLPIRARLDALDASELPHAAREQFAAVRRSVAYLQQLSDGLHLLALDPDDHEASAGSTNLQEWWTQIGPLLVKAVPKRVTLEKEFADGLPDIAVPPHRLTQAVLNLVVNAGEAIPDRGFVRIIASAAQAGHVVELAVSDSGQGMSPEVIKQAFDPFFTTKKRGLGTGLGLSLVRGVAQSAGGSVAIESEPGKGTTVRLRLPSADDAQQARGDDALTNAAVVTLRDRRVASFVSALLQSSGLAVKYEGEPDGTRCRVWVTQAEAGSFDAARRYLKSNRRGRVILFGAPQDPWDLPGVEVVDDPLDLDAVRCAIGQALAPNDEALA